MSAKPRRIAVTVALALATLAVPVTTALATAAPPPTWAAPHQVDPPRGGFSSVSCVSASFCRAAGSHGDVWGWDGTRWSLGRSFGDPQTAELSALECVTARFCVASLGSTPVGGPGHIVMFDGRHWREYSSNAIGREYGRPTGDISCASTRFCMMTLSRDGNLNYYRVWNGSSWSPKKQYAELDSYPETVSCWAPDGCFATGVDSALYRWTGSSWTKSSQRYQIRSLDCVSAEFCVGAADRDINPDPGEYAYVYRNGTWTQSKRLAEAPFSAVSCASTTRCVILSERGTSLAYNGSSWTFPRRIEDYAVFTGLSCPTTTFCAGVSAQGDILHRYGNYWGGARPVDPLLGGPSAVSCATGTQCVLVDANGGYSTYAGGAWTPPRRAVSNWPGGFSDISCPTTTFCLADERTELFGDNLYTLRNGQWSTLPGTPSGYFGDDYPGTRVSCSSSTVCALAWNADYDEGSGGEPYFSAWNGHAWTTKAVDDGDAASAVSCADDTCLAAAGSVLKCIVVGTGTGWSDVAALPGDVPVASLSCTAAGACQAITATASGRGQAFGWDGTTWTATSAASAVPSTAVSCASATSCVAVGGLDASRYDGAAWSAPAPIFTPNPGVRGSFADVSCHGSLCVAVDSYGVAVAS